MKDFMTRFLDAIMRILDRASDSLRGSSSVSDVDIRMLGGTVEVIRDGRSEKEREFSIRWMCSSEGPM